MTESCRRKRWVFSILGAVLALQFHLGCASLRPDVYQGDGFWMSGDGAIFEASPPLQVIHARIAHVNQVNRVRKEEERKQNEKGETVIREREFWEIEAGFDIEIELENGELYTVFLKGTGKEGQSVVARSSFAASNGYRQSVTGQIYLSRERQRVMVTIESKGPVRYQNTLIYYP